MIYEVSISGVQSFAPTIIVVIIRTIIIIIRRRRRPVTARDAAGDALRRHR